MGYIEKSLSSDEKIISKFKLHWLNFISGYIGILAFGLGLIVLIGLWSTEYGLTNKRVILKTGFISRKTQEIKLSKIETIEIRQPVLGRIFGYGNVKITGMGISDVKLIRVANPLEVKKVIENNS